MSPPFFNFNRRLPGLATLARLQPTPIRPGEPDASYLDARREAFRDSFARAGEADPAAPAGDLEAAITLAESMARGGSLGEYAAVLNFRSLQLERAREPAERDRIRAAALRWAEEALQAVSTAPGFTRDRVRALYDNVLALSAVLAREGRAELPEAERALLRRFFVQIRGGIEQHRLEREAHPEYPPIPEYFESYARAEQALLEGEAEAALRAFLETRGHIRALPGAGLFRTRVERGTEYAIRALQGDGSGTLLENLRSRSSLDALLLFDQVDGGTQADLQALSLAALALAEGDWRGASARGLLEFLRGVPGYPEGEVDAVLQDLEALHAARPEFRRACEAAGLAPADAAPEAVCQALLRRASSAARRILERQDREPYVTVFRHDTEDRSLRQAVEALQASPDLTREIRSLLNVPPALPQRLLVQQLVEYGPLAETMLEGLPAAAREQAAYASFSRAILQVAGADSDRLRRRFEQPLSDLVESLGALSRDDDRYAPAYEYFFRNLAETEGEVAPGVTLPESLRNRAAALRAALTDFNGRRLFRHLSSADSLLGLASGIALTELMPLGLLRWARNGGTWLRAGRLTWQSELAVGLGVGVAMSAVGGVHHLATSPRPWSEELSCTLPALALGTLFSSLGMAGTMGLGRLSRRAFLAEGVTGNLALRYWGARGLTFLGGGGLMLGAGAITEGLSTGHWRRPSAETAAETYLHFLMWDLGAAGLRRLGHRFWWRAQLGPHLLRTRVEPMSARLQERNPWLAQTPGEIEALEAHLGRRLLSGRDMRDLETGLSEGLEPYWQNGAISFRARTETPHRRIEPAREADPPVAPADAADEVRGPDRALPVERRPMDAIHNIPFETLQALWNLPMRALPREILSSPLLRPIHHLRVGGHDFYLSRVIEAVRTRSSGETERRRYVLALVPVEVEGQRVLKRRMFYVSASDAGAWRASPYMAGDAHLAKGVGRHYTQETQPVWEIAEALMRLEQSGPSPHEMPLTQLLRYISTSSEALGPAGVRTMTLGFQEEVDFPRPLGISNLRAMRPGSAFALPPGWGWGSTHDIQNTLRQMISLSWPDGFIPDFHGSPTRAMAQPNSLLGPLVFREFRGATAVDRNTGRTRPLVWILGEDGSGRAWVRHIHYGDSEVNSYGVYADVLESGILTSKPLEYFEQAALLPEPLRRPFNGEYVDISPALTLLEPIRRYRESRGLRPMLREEDTPTVLNPER